MTDSLPLDVVRALEIFVLEQQTDYTFVLVTPPPAWASQVLQAGDPRQPVSIAAAFPALLRFLSEADAFWRDGGQRSMLSPPFPAQVGAEEVLLRACALNIGPRSVLVIERLRGDADPRAILQKARENRLVQEQLQRQVDGAQQPIAQLAAALSELQQTTLTPAQRELADRMGKAVQKLQQATAARI